MIRWKELLKKSENICYIRDNSIRYNTLIIHMLLYNLFSDLDYKLLVLLFI